MKRAWAVAVLGPFVAAILAVGAVLASAAPAAAHASLVSTDPAEGEVLPETPDDVTFTFDEQVRLTADSIRVFDADGAPLEAEASSRSEEIVVDLPDELDDGTYVVVWQVVSADGHPIAGSLTFSIGAPSLEVARPQIEETDPGPVRRVLSVVQGLEYAGLLLSAGLLVFAAWALRGVRDGDVVRARVVRVAWWSAGLATLAAVAAIPLSGAYQQGLPLSKLGESQTTDLALVGKDALVLAVIAAGLLVALMAVSRERWRVAVVPAALLAACAPALVGHSRAIDPVWLMTITDVVHLVCGAVWFGGLVGLALTLGPLSGRERDAALVLSRFSGLAAALLGLLAVTGVLMGWRILEGWAPLFDTGYGRVLLVKVGTAALVALVAGYNRFRLLPRAVDGVGHTERRRAALGVRRAVRIEVGLLVVVLGLTGFLTTLSPREVEDTRPAVPSRVDAALAGEVKVLVTAAPGRRGPNTLLVQMQNQAGEPADQFAEPVVSLSAGLGGDETPVDLGEQPVTPVATGTYAVQVVFPSSGTWKVQVSVRASEFDNPVAVVEVEIA